MEEQVGRFGVERDVSDFVDDDQPVAGYLAQFGIEAVGAMRFCQPGDPASGRGECDPVPGVGGSDRQRGRQMGLAGAWRPEQHDVAGFSQPAPGL